MKSASLMALDIGGSSVRCAYVGSSGVRVHRLAWSSTQTASDDWFQLTRWFQLLPRRVEQLVVAFPGLLQEETVVSWPNRPHWEGVNLVQRLQGVVHSDALRLDDDANLAARCSRSLFGKHDALFVSVGTGIGGSLVIGGSTFRGVHGHACEIGHTIADSGIQTRCPCGRRGCLQLIASGRGMLNRLRERHPNLREAEVSEMLRAEHPEATAVAVLNEGARALARAVCNALTLFDVDHVHAGGGVMSNQRYSEEFSAALQEYEDSFTRRKLRLVLRAYDNPTLVGALLTAAQAAQLSSADQDKVRAFARPRAA